MNGGNNFLNKFIKGNFKQLFIIINSTAIISRRTREREIYNVLYPSFDDQINIGIKTIKCKTCAIKDKYVLPFALKRPLQYVPRIKLMRISCEETEHL